MQRCNTGKPVHLPPPPLTDINPSQTTPLSASRFGPARWGATLQPPNWECSGSLWAFSDSFVVQTNLANGDGLSTAACACVLCGLTADAQVTGFTHERARRNCMTTFVVLSPPLVKKCVRPICALDGDRRQLMDICPQSMQWTDLTLECSRGLLIVMQHPSCSASFRGVSDLLKLL